MSSRDDDYFYMSPAPLLVVDIEKALIKHANPAALELYEAVSAEELGSRAPDIIGPEGKDAVDKIKYLLDSGELRVRVETVHRTLTDRPINILLHISVPETNGAPDFSSVMVYPKDITEDKLLGEKLRVLSVLPEANPNIVVIMQCENKLVYLNPAAKEWLRGYRLYDYELIRKLLPDDFQKTICSTCDRKQNRNWTKVIDSRVFDVKLSPLPDGGRCMIMASDVTEYERLSEEHKIFHRAFSSVRTAIMVTDPEGKIIFANSSFSRIYGISPEEVIGKNPNIINPGRQVYYDLGIDDEAYNQLFSGLWKDILDPEKGFWEGEFYNKRADGSLIHVHAIIQAIRNERGELISFIAFPVDLSEKEAQELEVRLEIFRTIADVAELRDNETGNHIVRVGRCARRLAEELGLSKKFCRDIELFAPLHDIGKVGIPDSVLLAPRKLTDEEFDQIKTHTILGWELLKDKKSMEFSSIIARGHHERWDGKGYPQAARGEDIPLAARITSVSDVYDALRSERPYKKAWSHEDSMNELIRNKETQFDPAIIDAFVSCSECIERIYEELPD